MQETIKVDVAVIGAGQAGLASGYYLKQLGIDFVLLDSSSRIGNTWRDRYDSLTLFSPRPYSSLPGKPFPDHPNPYPNKTEIADYLESYAAAFDLPVHFNTSVLSLSRLETGNPIYPYKIHTNQGFMHAKQVIITAGACQQPFIPKIKGKLDNQIQQLHSSLYRNPTQLASDHILVVGAGNSGAQIAVELAKAGRKVTLSTTRKPVYSPHRIWGISVFWWFSTLKFYDILTVNTRLGRKLMNLPEPIMGKELNHLLEKGIITLKPKLTSLWSEEAAFEDNSKVKVDSVVWCTGYEWLCHFMQIPDACHEDGLLLHSRGISPIPGLYYVGLPWQHKRTSGLLMGVGDDARYVVTHIKRTLLS